MRTLWTIKYISDEKGGVKENTYTIELPHMLSSCPVFQSVKLCCTFYLFIYKYQI